MKTTETEKQPQSAVQVAEALTVNANGIKSHVARINVGYKTIKAEKAVIRAESGHLLNKVLEVIKTDNRILDGRNLDLQGINFYYIKIQSLLSEIDEVEQHTKKIISAVLRCCLVAPKVNFSLFVETFKDLELFDKHFDNLRAEDLTSNSAFNERVNKVIEAKGFINTYNSENMHLISKGLRVALAKVELNIEIGGTSVTSWLDVVKNYKMSGELLSDFIIALDTAKQTVRAED